jgi:biopolymer transport protein ExbD
MPAATRRKKIRVHEAEKLGELNIVPYLDIIINLTMFMLASMAGFVQFGIVNVSAPQYGAAAAAAAGEKKKDEKPPLLLAVAITKNGFFIAGSGGVLGSDEPTATGAPMTEKPPTVPLLADGKYDYVTLTSKLVDVKKAYPEEKKVIVMADQEIQYEVVVRTMDAIREDGPNQLFYEVVLGAL